MVSSLVNHDFEVNNNNDNILQLKSSFQCNVLLHFLISTDDTDEASQTICTDYSKDLKECYAKSNSSNDGQVLLEEVFQGWNTTCLIDIRFMASDVVVVAVFLILATRFWYGILRPVLDSHVNPILVVVSTTAMKSLGLDIINSFSLLWC